MAAFVVGAVGVAVAAAIGVGVRVSRWRAEEAARDAALVDEFLARVEEFEGAHARRLARLELARLGHHAAMIEAPTDRRPTAQELRSRRLSNALGEPAVVLPADALPDDVDLITLDPFEVGQRYVAVIFPEEPRTRTRYYNADALAAWLKRPDALDPPTKLDYEGAEFLSVSFGAAALDGGSRRSPSRRSPSRLSPRRLRRLVDALGRRMRRSRTPHQR